MYKNFEFDIECRMDSKTQGDIYNFIQKKKYFEGGINMNK